MLRSRAKRLGLVLFVLLIGGGATWGFLNRTHVKPTDFYYIAVPFSEDIDGNSVDIRSPTGLAIVDMRVISGVNIVDDCREAKLTSVYRDVQYCDKYNHAGKDHEMRAKYFHDRVDESYGWYISNTVDSTVSGIAAGGGVWLLLAASYLVTRWVWAGTPSAKSQPKVTEQTPKP